MEALSWKFRGKGCFQEDWVGFDRIHPINLIIGRNNSGKSRLLDLVEGMATGGSRESPEFGFEQQLRVRMPEEMGRRVASLARSSYGGLSDLVHQRWKDHQLVGWSCRRKTNAAWLSDDFEAFVDQHCSGYQLGPKLKHEAEQASSKVALPLRGSFFRRLRADRDILPETREWAVKLGEQGEGATNLIRGCVYDSRLDHRLVEERLLQALQSIFELDGAFSEIRAREAGGDQNTPKFEVFLMEKEKGTLVPLSASGSGLKTVILVLLNLLVVPAVEEKPLASCVFAFEELENNLHPTLLRRLLAFIEAFAKEHGSKFFLTTHSPTALDFFTASEDAGVVLVEHDGRSATTRTVADFGDCLGVLQSLGCRPSDLLLANGVLWVEGPSDRIYLRRLIDLYSDGRLVEGRDYQCACYAGALLKHASFAPEPAPENGLELDEAQQQEFIRLVRLNHNVAVVCDGDRTHKEAVLKDHVLRVQEEIGTQGNHAFFWATEAKEIENYVPGEVFTAVRKQVSAKVKSFPDPSRFDRFPSEPAEADFWRRHGGPKHFDKVAFARDAAAMLTRENLAGRFELKEKLEALVAVIRSWNG